MATSNFMTYDAGSIYAISSRDLFCEEENNVSDDVLNDDFSWYYDDVKENIYSDLLELERVFIRYSGINVCDGDSISRSNFNRNFDGEGIAIVEATKEYGDLEVSISVSVVALNGYYDGINFDYIAKAQINGYEECDYSEIEECFELSDFNSSMNNGMLKIQNRNAKKWLLEVGEDIQNRIEKVLKANVAHELKTVARFSNGETMYEAV